MKNLGFIGIGHMGYWMSQHLLAAGYNVYVYDTNVQAMDQVATKGAHTTASPSEVGQHCSHVILMLPNSKVVEQVVLGEKGLATSLAAGSRIIDMSSSYVLDTRSLAEKLAKKGIALIDAPVSGGVKGAREGSLTIMVGGEKEVFQEIRPLLEKMGSHVNHVGKTGAGHALKAINNYLSAASMYATTEAMVLAKKLDLDLEVALETINQSSGRSFSTEYKFPTFVLPQKYDSGFSLNLLLKDVKMVQALAHDTEVPILMGAVVEQIYQAALNNGKKEQDHTEIVQFLERLADCQLHKE